jgi:serine/threonine protein kinase/tetratricopeptide (TPR) repeat protein
MALEPGTVIGHYVIVSPLGAGGMGEVYLATDQRLDRQVAIKVIAESVAGDTQRLHRFMREARTASRLNHAHIAHVYEIGEAGGRHYIAMEYVRGDSLAQRIRGKPMPPSDVIVYATQIADALDEAHNHGVIHRDLKPANAIISSRGRLKIVDFGLAKSLTDVPGSDPSMTTHPGDTDIGVVLGTVDYMSPEQVRGLTVDQRSDIFSLGVMVYEMLTGRLPFAGTSRTDTVFRITQAQPEAISRYAYDVPEDLDRIVRKCLEKAREHRYQNMRDLLVDLSKLRRDSSAILLPIGPHGGVRQYRRVALAIAALAIGLATLAIPAALWLRPDTIESLAVVRGTSAAADSRAAELTDGVASSLVSSLSLLSSLRVAPRQMSLSERNGDRNPLDVARGLNVHAALMVSVVPRGDAATLNVELVDVRHGDGTVDWSYQETRLLTEIELAPETIASRVAENLNLRVSVADQRTREVNQLYQRGRVYASRRTDADLRRAVALFEQAIARDPNYALAHAGLAYAHNLAASYSFTPPGEAFPIARRSAQRALELDRNLAEGQTQLGFVLFRNDWDWAGAERAFFQSITLDPSNALTRHWLALLLSTTGRFKESLLQIRDAQRLDPLSMQADAVQAQLLYMARDYESAVATAREAIAAGGSPYVAHRYLGMALQQLGKHDQAIEALTTALTKEGGASTLLKGDLGTALAAAGRTAEATQVYGDLLSQQRRPGAVVSPVSLAMVATALGDTPQALTWLETAYRTRANQINWIKVDPRFDRLRREPRFLALLKQLRLE